MGFLRGRIASAVASNHSRDEESATSSRSDVRINVKLEGSCHCGAVRFTLESASAVPFMHCHCSICRKTAGSGGFAINLGGDARSMKVKGEQHHGRYHAVMRDAGKRATRSQAPDSAMLTRIIFLCALALLALKLFAPQRLRLLGKQIDRVVNATLIALGVVYSVQIALYLLGKP